MSGPGNQYKRDFIVIEGSVTPGVAVIRNAGTPRSWDVRQGYGFSGAFIIFTGIGLSRFEVDFTLSDDDLDDWQAFASVYFSRPPSGTFPLALGIYHPLLVTAPISISKVVLEDCSSLEQDEDGFWHCTAKFLEYRPPVQALAKPQGAIPATATASIPALSAAKQELAGLQAQFAALPSR